MKRKILFAVSGLALGSVVGWGIFLPETRSGPAESQPAGTTSFSVNSAEPEEFPNTPDQFKDAESLDALLQQREIIRQWAIERPKELARWISESQHQKHNALREWAKLDPTGMISTLKSEGKTEALILGLGHLDDPVFAYAELGRIDELPEQENDPFSNRVAYHYFETKEHLFFKVARRSPQQAVDLFEPFLEWAKGFGAKQSYLFSESRETVFAQDLASALAESDPVFAAEWATNLDTADLRRRCLSNVIARWATTDFESAGRLFEERSSQLGGLDTAIVHQLSQTAPATAILWADRFGDPGKKTNLIVSSATEMRDVGEIAATYRKMTCPQAREKFVEQLLINWQNRDLRKGFDWVREISTDETAERWLDDLASGVGCHRFESAMQLSREIEDKGQRAIFRRELIKDLATGFPEKALELAKAEGDETYYEALGATLRYHADSLYFSPEEVAEMLEEYPDDHQSWGAAYQLGWRWAGQDPDAAFEWMDSVEHPAHRREAIQSVLGRLAISDPAKAEQWAAAQISAPDRNEAFATLAKQHRETDPEKAFGFASEISYAKRRTGQLREIVRTWSMRDPAASLAAVQSSTGFGAREKARLLARIYR